MMEVATSPSSRTFQSAASAMSTYTKIRLPVEEAVKAEFPPNCKVLCFDDNGFRVGLVRNVMVSISLPSQRTFGTFYEVEMKGVRSLDQHMIGIFTASDLRLTPGCPVEVDAEYFGEVFKFAGNSNGKVRGIVLGSFEAPPPRFMSCPSGMSESTETPRKFFYSVRVKFNGMEEAIEAHGVPPEHVSVSNSADSDMSIVSEGVGALMIGGGTYNNQVGSFGGESDECKENHRRPGFFDAKSGTPRRLRRVAPEDVPMTDFSNQHDSMEPQETNTNVNAMYQHENSTKSFRDSIANGGRQMYDSEDGSSSFEERQPVIASPRRQRGRSHSMSRSRSEAQTRSRSTSNMRTYVKPQPDRSARPNAIPTAPHSSSAKTIQVAESIESYDSVQDYHDVASVEDNAHETDEDNSILENNNEEPVAERKIARGPMSARSPKSHSKNDPHHELDREAEGKKSKTPNRPVLNIRNMDQYDISDDDEDSYDDDREAMAPTPRSKLNLTDARHSPESYDYDEAGDEVDHEAGEEEFSYEESNEYDEASFTDDDQIAPPVEDHLKSSPVPPVETEVPEPVAVGKRAKKFGSTWSPSPRNNESHVEDSSPAAVPPPPVENVSPATPPVEKKAKKFGSTWSPSPRNEKSNESSVRSPSPMRRNTSFGSVQKASADTPSMDDMAEGCYLLYDQQSGGRLTLQYSKSKVENAFGFWAPGEGKKIQGFKFKQNQGRSDLVSGLAGKDSKKNYFNGWCQFVKAAKSYNGLFCKWSNKGKIEIDVYVYYGETCEIVMIEDGQPFDVSLVDAVAVLPKGNGTFNGVRTGEYGVFLGRGDAVGASMAL